jgi:hypothetical protein
MKTQNSFSTTTSPTTLAGRLRTACAARLLLPLLLLLALPAVAQAQDDDYAYAATNGTITITVYIGYGGDVTIPDTIDGLPVTSIGDEAFSAFYWDTAGLTSVIIPDSVTNIGGWVFGGCTNLTAITVATDNPAYRSVAGVLFNKSTTTLIQCPGGKAGSYTIPNSVTSIGDGAFEDCVSLTNAVIGNSVTNIGDYAFDSCSSLSRVYFLGNAPTIGWDIFYVDFPWESYPTVFYLQGTTGWSSPFGDCPAVQRNRHFQVSDDSFGVRTNQFGFNITGTSDLVIVVEACTNLANPTWSPVGTNNLTGGFTTGSCYFSDPDWTNYPTRFYRLRSP